MVNIKQYLRESNAIEGVYEDQAVETAYQAWKKLNSRDQLTEPGIKTAHQTLLKYRQPDIAGVYRDCNVRIGGDIPPTPEKVPELMEQLITTTPESQLEALDWHIRFEKIHPFADGNGRIGRLIYLWHCHVHLHHDPLVWSEEDKHGYYSLFEEEGYKPKLCD